MQGGHLGAGAGPRGGGGAAPGGAGAQHGGHPAVPPRPRLGPAPALRRRPAQQAQRGDQRRGPGVAAGARLQQQGWRVVSLCP